MENYLPGYTGDQPNINTGMAVTVEGQTTSQLPNGDAIPFPHLSRLADKLFGAVEVNLDRYIEEANYEADVTQQVGTPNALLPQSFSSWLERNAGIVTAVSLIASVLGIISFLRR